MDNKKTNNNSNEKYNNNHGISAPNFRGCPNPFIEGLLGVSFSIHVLESLGPIQLEILYKYWVDDMPVKKIANSRKTSENAVKNIKSKLIKNGVIDKFWRPIKGTKTYQKNGGGSPTLSPQNSKGLYRLHGQNHVIEILSTSKQYLKLNFPNQFELDNNTIILYRRKILIYSNTFFYDDVPDNCFEKANVYWNNLILRIAAKYNIKLIDGQNTKINIFKQHIAKTNDALAQKVINNKLNYEFRDDLNRLRLIIDNSKGLWEFEAVDAELCQDDINIIKNIDGDYITNPHYRPSEIKTMIDTLTNSQTLTQTQINEMLLGVKGIVKTIDSLQTEVIELKRNI